MNSTLKIESLRDIIYVFYFLSGGCISSSSIISCITPSSSIFGGSIFLYTDIADTNWSSSQIAFLVKAAGFSTLVSES